MFQLKTEDDLFSAFRTRDRRHVTLPEDVKFPLFVRDYLAWVEPTGVRAFLLFSAPGDVHPTGIAFRRDQSGDRSPTGMCEWCHSHGAPDMISLLTTDVTEHRRVGLSLCRDLGCGGRLEEVADRAGKNAREEARTLLSRMRRFAEEALGITQTNR